MVKKVLLGLAVVVVAFLGLVAVQPAKYHVERSLVIAAPRPLVFEQVNVMEKRHAWYPWDRLDPSMKLTYGGAKAGKGATYAWSGNDKVGEGKQEIVESVPNEKVVDTLQFIKPFESTNTATFTFVDDGAGTKVTWAMDGGGGFSTKLMNLFVNMDSQVGKDFEGGLKNLGEVAAAAAAVVPAAAAPAAAGDAQPVAPPK